MRDVPTLASKQPSESFSPWELWDRFGAENIERRMVECNSPIRRQAPFGAGSVWPWSNTTDHVGFFQFGAQIELMNLICPSEAI
jgi:hypothetical protein